MLLQFAHSEHSFNSIFIDLDDLFVKTFKKCFILDNHIVKFAKNGKIVIPGYSQWKLK